MLRTRIVNLSATPEDLTYSGEVDPPIALSIQNIMTSGYAYIGTESVSSIDYGHKLYPGQSFTIQLDPFDTIFAVGDSGVKIAVLSLDIR